MKEHHQAEKAKEEKAREQANLAAKDAAFDEKDRVEDAQKAASSLAKWDEVKSALDTLSTEVKIAREDKDAAAPDAGAIDPTLWSCETLKILRLRLPKGALTSLPADLGRLANLTELIVSYVYCPASHGRTCIVLRVMVVRVLSCVSWSCEGGEKRGVLILFFVCVFFFYGVGGGREWGGGGGVEGGIGVY